MFGTFPCIPWLFICLTFFLFSCGNSSTPPGDDDETTGDDDASSGDDDVTAGDDDSSAGDDDITAGDDDITAGDDDATSGDDDMTAPVDASPTPSLLPDGAYLLLVPDNQTNTFKVIDPRAGTLVYLLDLRTLNPTLCGSPMGCFIFGGSHAELQGHDYLDLTYGWAASGSMGLATGFNGNIDRVKISEPLELHWRLNQLDFSGLPGGAGAYCAVDPNDPCSANPAAPIQERGLCWVGDAHDFVVLSDDTDAQVAEIMVADTDNFRMFKTTLEYAGGNTCGKVTAFIDGARNEDWAIRSQPNNIVPVTRDEHELYIVNLRAIDEGHADSGMVQLWELEPTGTWVLHWTFPEQLDDGTPRFLIQPHGGELVEGGHPEGDLYRLGHSAGLATSTSFNAQNPPGGSGPVLLLRDIFSQPDYLYDLYQPPATDKWGYPRQVTEVGDGTLIVTDSGCQAAANCANPPRLIWLADVEETNSDKAGYWTADASQVELLDQTDNVLKTLECGFVNPYWTEVIPVEAQGEELKAAATSGGIACP